jgi:predicted lysophospholipase L1 biosynthesis ABC-type transport system permease subunit
VVIDKIYLLLKNFEFATQLATRDAQQLLYINTVHDRVPMTGKVCADRVVESYPCGKEDPAYVARTVRVNRV